MEQKGGNIGSNIIGVVENSVKAIEYFAKSLCLIIDLGVEVGETALNPNAPLSDPMSCDIPGT